MRGVLKSVGARDPYLSPLDHAFASGPVFTRPASPRAARNLFERREDGDLLMRVFEAFDMCATTGEGLRLGLAARIVSLNAARSVTIGRECAIRGTIRCEPGGRVDIGDSVYIGDDVIVSARTRITIGDATLVAHGVQAFDNDTHPADPVEREAHFAAILGNAERTEFAIAAKPVTIGRQCWLGFNSAVMKGVTVGDRAIIAAHAVVIDDVPPGSVVAGNPARVVKNAGQA